MAGVNDYFFDLSESTAIARLNLLPGEPLSHHDNPAGVRIGVQEMTRFGMKEPEMAAIADMICEVLQDIKNVEAAHKVRGRVRELTTKYPLPY